MQTAQRKQSKKSGGTRRKSPNVSARKEALAAMQHQEEGAAPEPEAVAVPSDEPDTIIPEPEAQVQEPQSDVAHSGDVQPVQQQEESAAPEPQMVVVDEPTQEAKQADGAAPSDDVQPPQQEENTTADAQAKVEAEHVAAASVQRSEPRVECIDLNRIVNSTYNPRKDLRKDSLQELADSIRQVGVLQPICVRPKDDGYEIVYGERRYWAAVLAQQTHIQALIRDMTDAEAEDAAITENLQREDVKPREEAAAYLRALQSGRHTVESLVGKFGKSESYIRSRLKLCELIDALSEQLDREEISVGVAIEIAKYPADIQQKVYEEHFAEGCYQSWRNARIKEIARNLYKRYMTKLDSYRFDKSECRACAHNTSNQVLFTDCAGECSGCQNRACMTRKNEEYLMQKALKMLRDDPRTMLAACVDTPSEILDKLEGNGYHVERLPNPLYSYHKAPEMPEAPNPSDYGSEVEYEADCNDYDAAMEEFTEQTRMVEYEVSEGRLRKYAILGTLDVEIRYEVIEEEEQEITVSDPDGSERKVFVTVVPSSPAETIRQQDRRNRELCYEHITSELKSLISDVKVAKAPLRKEEMQMFHYALMKHLRADFIRRCGIRSKDEWIRDEERYALAERLTDKQRAALVRYYLLDFFRQSAPELKCTDDNLDTKLLCQVMDLNYEKESQAVQQKHLEVYKKRKQRLQEQLDALKAQEDAVAREASAGEEPLLEPEEQPHEDPQPAVEDPQPTMFPVAPEQEPDTYQPEEELLAA